MLLKWLFTLLAIIWLYQAIVPFFTTSEKPTPRNPNIKNRKDDDDGDYIDYEEIK